MSPKKNTSYFSSVLPIAEHDPELKAILLSSGRHILQLALCFVIILCAIFFASNQGVRLAITLAATTVILCAYILLRKNHLRIAVHTLTIGLTAVVIGGATIDGGIASIGVHVFYLILVLVAVFLGEIALIQTGFIVICWAIVVYVAELMNWLPIPEYTHSPLINFILFTFLIIFAVSFLRFTLLQTMRSRTAIIEARNEANSANSANSAQNVFLANMSHELRTPLTAIIGYNDLVIDELERGDLNPETSLEDLYRIRATSYHLLNLINDILDLSKIEARRTTLHLVIVDITSLIDQVATIVRPLAEKNNNQLNINHSPIGYVMLDHSKIKQILLNLLSNAIKFTNNGVITLTCYTEKRQTIESIVIEIQDTGIGIPEAELELIFNSFYQVDTSLTRVHSGTGLGLSIVKNFIEMMSGSVQVQSQIGIGSTFTIKLPLIPENIEEETEI